MKNAFRAASFLCTLIFCSLTFKGLAQKGFEEGYVVTRSKDTLYGKIRDRKSGAFSSLYKKIKFRGKKGKSKYSPKEIIAYKIGAFHFESLPIVHHGWFFDEQLTVSLNGDFQFLKVIAKGHLSYYLMEFEDPDSGSIDTTGFFKKSDGSTLVRVNQGIFGLKRKKLAAFFSDCPELSQKIQTKQIKTPLEIVDFYNNWKAHNLH